MVSAKAAWQKRPRMVESVLNPAAARRRLGAPAFGKVSLAVTIATVFVVLFGAVVRITGSGAGCGQHWPSCNGEIAHLPRSIETWIELGHRTTSGLDFLAVVALMFLARARFPARHAARVTATLALALIIVEVLVGARLVLLNLVGSNLSFARVLIMPMHLVTTSLLLGALAATSYFGSDYRGQLVVERLAPARARLRGAFSWTLAAATLLLLVSITGAITALGDTAYPVQGATTLEHIQADHVPGAHFLGRMRGVHPLLALLGVAGLWAAAARARAATRARSVQLLSLGLYVGGATALGLGLANIGLGAPGYLQVAHLLMACLLWMSVVVLAAVLWDLQATTAE